MTPGLRVILCEDSADLREVIRRALERDGDLHVVGEADDATGLIALAARERPDAIVLDLMMPGGDPASLIPTVRSSAPDAGLVVFSGLGAERVRAHLNGHADVLHVPKTAPTGRLVAAVRAVASA